MLQRRSIVEPLADKVVASTLPSCCRVPRQVNGVFPVFNFSLFADINLLDEGDRVLKRKARFGTIATPSDSVSVDVCMHFCYMCDMYVCMYVLCNL